MDASFEDQRCSLEDLLDAIHAGEERLNPTDIRDRLMSLKLEAKAATSSAQRAKQKQVVKNLEAEFNDLKSKENAPPKCFSNVDNFRGTQMSDDRDSAMSKKTAETFSAPDTAEDRMEQDHTPEESPSRLAKFRSMATMPNLSTGRMSSFNPSNRFSSMNPFGRKTADDIDGDRTSPGDEQVNIDVDYDDEDDIDPRDIYVDPEQLSAMEQDGDRIQYHTKQAAHRTMRMAAEAQEIGHNTIS